jgi:hypothetical protein
LQINISSDIHVTALAAFKTPAPSAAGQTAKAQLTQDIHHGGSAGFSGVAV